MRAPDKQTVYIAPADRIAEVKTEIKNVVFEKENFLLASGGPQKTVWAQNVWTDVKTEKIESIAKAAKFLRDIQRNWWHFPLSHVRRATLIQDSLPRIKNAPLKFPTPLHASPLGSFALKSENELIYSAGCTAAVPNGEFNFEAPACEAPSTAYLKLWEALTRFGSWPKPGEFCVDLGSSPGSWTQALLELGAEVLSVDKAELTIPPYRKLQYLKKDAFKIDPAATAPPQWIFSDIICYPQKLLELAQAWKRAHPRANFIFTIKFQGGWDAAAVEAFSRIENSTVCHLFNNKHELCWLSKPSVG